MCFYGILYLAPKALIDITSNALEFNLIITASQFACVIIPVIGVENPKIGRKKILIFTQAVYTLCVLLITIFRNTEVLVIGMSIGVVMSETSLIVMWTYTSEAYPTKMRGIALSIN